MANSKYNDTTNLKVTYLLGAGASFNAVPIWGEQAKSMIQVAGELLKLIETKFKKHNTTGPNYHQTYLRTLANKINSFGQKALEFGSIDIYARRLFLLNEKEELNNLKKCLSIYFDLWESGLMNCHKSDEKEQRKYKLIDPRYFSLLSVLLQPNGKSPIIHSNVSFITWNYDLQFEKAYETFLPEKEESLSELIKKINCQGEDNKIIHLNGFRGVFRNENEEFEIVEKSKFFSIESYLNEIFKNKGKFDSEDHTFQNSIKYAWEQQSESTELAMRIMKKSDILVIIGYSFPAFNRAIDKALIDEFEKGSGNKRVIYQDPSGNSDIMKYLFNKSNDIKLEKENTDQFYIPHEFLSPSKGEFFVF